MAADNAQFRRNFAAIMERAGEKKDKLAVMLAMEVLRRLIDGSPVGNASLWKNPASAPEGYVGGRFKANWQVEYGGPDLSNSLPPDSFGSGSMGRGKTKVQQWNVTGKLFITNSMPYCKRIEYDSWSQQAPAGVVRITVKNFKQLVKKLADRL
jgi:hypothetical protein